MEFRVDEFQVPEAISFNAEELKASILEIANYQASLVYTPETLKDAKKVVANNRAFDKTVNDERIRIKKEYMKPYEKFEAEVKAMLEPLKKATANIDDQIKDFEAQQKLEKKEKIFALFNEIKHEAPENARFIAFSQIFKESWCNASVSMKSIKEEINFRFIEASRDITTLEALPEFSFEAVELYKQSLNMADAISEAKRMSDMQKAKTAAYEGTQAEKLAEVKATESAPFMEERKWISFRANLTTADAFALKDFFISRAIQFESI